MTFNILRQSTNSINFLNQKYQKKIQIHFSRISQTKKKVVLIGFLVKKKTRKLLNLLIPYKLGKLAQSSSCPERSGCPIPL